MSRVQAQQRRLQPGTGDTAGGLLERGRSHLNARFHPLSGSVRPGLVFTGIVLLALNLRTAVTSLPPLLDRVTADIPLTAAQIGLLGALPPLAFSAAGVFGVRLLRRWSAETLAVIVLLVSAGGALLRPFLPQVPAFLLLTLVTLLGMGLGNIVLPPLVKAWFPHRIGQVTAAYVTMIALGTSLPALLAIPVAGALPGLDWRAGLGFWGLVALVVVPLWLLVARTPRALATHPAGSTAATHGHRLSMRRSHISWGLALLFGMNALNLYAMFTWLSVRLVDAGLSEAAAGARLALFAGVGVVPSLLLPPLLARFAHLRLHAFAVVVGCVGCYVVGYLGLLLTPLHLTALWTTVAGLGGGGFPVVLTLIGLRSASPASAGVLAGFSQGLGYLGAALGPVVFGVLHQVSGAWTLPFCFLFGSLLLMLLAGWIVSPQLSVDDDLHRRALARAGRASTPDTLGG